MRLFPDLSEMKISNRYFLKSALVLKNHLSQLQIGGNQQEKTGKLNISVSGKLKFI